MHDDPFQKALNRPEPPRCVADGMRDILAVDVLLDRTRVAEEDRQL
jgi:hypothetical protein